jgi:hypothetical protein
MAVGPHLLQRRDRSGRILHALGVDALAQRERRLPVLARHREHALGDPAAHGALQLDDGLGEDGVAHALEHAGHLGEGRGAG